MIICKGINDAYLLGADVQLAVQGKDPQSPRKLLLRLHALLHAKRGNIALSSELPSSKPVLGDDGSSELGGEKEKEGAAIGGGDSTAGGVCGFTAVNSDGSAGAVSGDVPATKPKVPVVQAAISAAAAAPAVKVNAPETI